MTTPPRPAAAMGLHLSRRWLYGVAAPIGLIVFPVFVDIAYGLLGTAGRAGFLSIGVVLRGAIALASILLLLRMRARPLKAFLFVLLCVFLASNLVWALESEVYSFGHELNRGFKIAFPWLIAGTLLFLDRRAPIEPAFLLTLVAWAGFLSAAALIGSAAAGIDRETYGDWSYGSKGMFNAQNDIGLAMLLGLVAAAAMLIRTRKPVYLVMTAAIASAGILLGTRTGVLGPPLVAALLLAATVPNRRLFNPADGRRSLVRSAVLVVPVAVAALVAGIVLSQSDKTDFLFKQIEALGEGTPRQELEAAGIQRLRERSPLFSVFGDGALAFKMYVAENAGKDRRRIDTGSLASMGESEKLAFAAHPVENDVIDVLGFYGALQFAVIYGAIALVYGLTVRRAIRAWNLENVAWLLIFTLFLGHSTLAGHGLLTPQVSTMVAPALFLQLRTLSWRRRDLPAHAPMGPSATMGAKTR